MMQKLLGAVLIIAVLLGLKELHRYWEEVKTKQQTEQQALRGHDPRLPAPVEPTGSLPALPPHLQASLEQAKQQGPAALKIWLDRNRHLVQDPRLADIELDYVLLLGARNFTEARQRFSAVRDRTPTNSPVYPRIQQLQRHYE
jgi:hypothetical protein